MESYGACLPRKGFALGVLDVAGMMDRVTEWSRYKERCE